MSHCYNDVFLKANNILLFSFFPRSHKKIRLLQCLHVCVQQQKVDNVLILVMLIVPHFKRALILYIYPDCSQQAELFSQELCCIYEPGYVLDNIDNNNNNMHEGKVSK